VGCFTPQLVFYGWLFALGAFAASVRFLNFAVRRYSSAGS
jgi:ABC-type uncharacterized transport system permease subunit